MNLEEKIYKEIEKVKLLNLVEMKECYRFGKMNPRSRLTLFDFSMGSKPSPEVGVELADRIMKVLRKNIVPQHVCCSNGYVGEPHKCPK